MYQEMGMDMTHQTEVRLHLKTCNASFVNTGIVDSLRLSVKIGQPTDIICAQNQIIWKHSAAFTNMVQLGLGHG